VRACPTARGRHAAASAGRSTVSSLRLRWLMGRGASSRSPRSGFRRRVLGSNSGTATHSSGIGRTSPDDGLPARSGGAHERPPRSRFGAPTRISREAPGRCRRECGGDGIGPGIGAAIVERLVADVGWWSAWESTEGLADPRGRGGRCDRGRCFGPTTAARAAAAAAASR